MRVGPVRFIKCTLGSGSAPVAMCAGGAAESWGGERAHLFGVVSRLLLLRATQTVSPLLPGLASRWTGLFQLRCAFGAELVGRYILMTGITYRGSDSCPLYATIIDPAGTAATMGDGALLVLLHGGGSGHQSLIPLARQSSPARSGNRSTAAGTDMGTPLRITAARPPRASRARPARVESTPPDTIMARQRRRPVAGRMRGMGLMPGMKPREPQTPASTREITRPWGMAGAPPRHAAARRRGMRNLVTPGTLGTPNRRGTVGAPGRRGTPDTARPLRTLLARLFRRRETTMPDTPGTRLPLEGARPPRPLRRL